MKPKKELIRVVLTPEGEMALDLTGKRAGRGAYICKKMDCFVLARKKKALDRSLKSTVSEEIYDHLMEELSKVDAHE
jgi:predicted RNA-binding protein YlxR (DUF448 family)